MEIYELNGYQVQIKRDRENKLGAEVYIDLQETTEEGDKYLRLSAHKTGRSLVTHAYVIYRENQGQFSSEKFTMFQDFRTTYGSEPVSRLTEKVLKQYVESTMLDQDYVTEVLAKAEAHYL